MSQPALFDHEFRTARAARPVHCHQEFLDKLAERRNEPVGKRAALLMQRMAVDIARLHYKGTSGVNRGWRRSRLGGSSGSHFYAWWAPAGAAPLKSHASFETHAEAIFLRDIRHHDDHRALESGDAAADYLPMSVADLRGGEYLPDPLTQPQVRFARARGAARILKGHPGSGKTTALLHAADASNAERVLYLTFSQDLAALARDYFDRFCSGSRTFTVLTYPVFLRQILGESLAAPDGGPAEVRGQFRRDTFNFQRSLGAWSQDLDALYDEMHAHLVGAAVPTSAGRFSKAENQRLPDSAYRAQRTRYLGAATESVLECARRLERAGGPLGPRYFPELAFAWRAAEALTGGAQRFERGFLDYGCVAVDEVQDLTPLEAFVVVSLARRLARQSPLLLAGDEAQTVRPTDFEWAWLNDILHDLVGQPSEFKLTVNLRSPRRIAELVNRAWDLYDFILKQDRPSGAGYAELGDDAPDQVLFATSPQAGLAGLLTDLSRREGLALIAFDKAALPKETDAFVLSPAEAKGLDFHSVCVLNGGALLRRIVDERASGPAANLGKRLAIDQLRVALSRPAERLIWLDAAPDPATVREAGRLLRSLTEDVLTPVTVEALLTCLGEEDLEIEERLQRCQKDARQFVAVKPDLAWSRANQAVSLSGQAGNMLVVVDHEARVAAHLTLSEVCFQLAFRRLNLSAELGRPDLYEHATLAARTAGLHLLAGAIREVGAAERAFGPDRVNNIAMLMQVVAEARKELPGWFIVEIAPRAEFWIEELSRTMETGDNALVGYRILPPFFSALGLPDAEGRKARLAQRAVHILMKGGRFAAALTILEGLSEAKPKLAAECYEETGQFEKAARLHLELGDRERALKCYRSIPDFAASLDLVRQMEDHAARPALEWLSELDGVMARRPANFSRVMTAGEKKLLEGMLERGLGVQRRKSAPKKAAAKAPKKTAPRKRKAEDR